MSPAKPAAIPLAVSVLIAGCSTDVPRLQPKQPLIKDRLSLTSKPQLGQARSPQAAVIKLWSDVEHGSLLTALYSYDPRVRRAFRVTDLLGALAAMKTTFGYAQPQITGVERTPVGALVYARFLVNGKPQGLNSYLVRRDRGRWRITYDSTLRDELVNYTERKIDKGIVQSSGPSPAARRAGDAIGRQYLLLFAPRGAR